MNIKLLKGILVLALIFVATSCIVGPQGIYYEPIYPDKSAIVEGGWAYGTAGPPSVLKFITDDGVTVKTELNPLDNGTMNLRISVDVPPGYRSQFTSKKIQIVDPDSGREWVKNAQEIKLLQGPVKLIPATGIVNFDEIGPTESKYLSDNMSWKDFQVWVPFSINDFFPHSVKIYLPTIVDADREYHIPAVELIEDKEVKEKNRIEAKGKLRNLWWPYNEKDSKDDLWLSVDGFTVGGGVTGGYIDNQFGGNIMVSFPPSRKWKFSSDMIRILDLDTGEEHRVQFKNINPQFHLTVDFTAPVIGIGSSVKVTAYSDTVINDASLESVIVQLPDILINQKKIHFKPITFRKSFGVGVIPLNY